MSDLYKTSHATIATMSEWERGWYHSFIMSLWYNGFEDMTEPTIKWRIPVDYDKEAEDWLICRYSPTGSQRHAESFYAPEPPPVDDLTDILWSEDKLRAVWVELDPHGLNYYRLEYHARDFYSEAYLYLASTESHTGLPHGWDRWPEAKDPITIPYPKED
jgi:hypothetical protein